MMRVLYCLLGCLVVLLSFQISYAQSDPPCLPQASVAEISDNPQHGWLSKENADTVKAHFEKIAAKYGRHWDGDTLIISCAIQGPAYDMPAVRVEGNGSGVSEAAGEKEFYLELAKRTGHTPQEADVLYKKYAQLHGTYYRQVPDEEGGSPSNEAAIILKRHEKKLGITEPTMSSHDDIEQRAKVLEKKINEAKQRGDFNEMMKLAAEAQKLSSSLVNKAAQLTRRTDQQTWLLLEDSYAELVQAAYRSRIVLLNCPCLQCSW